MRGSPLDALTIIPLPWSIAVGRRIRFWLDVGSRGGMLSAEEERGRSSDAGAASSPLEPLDGLVWRSMVHKEGEVAVASVDEAVAVVTTDADERVTTVTEVVVEDGEDTSCASRSDDDRSRLKVSGIER